MYSYHYSGKHLFVYNSENVLEKCPLIFSSSYAFMRQVKWRLEGEVYRCRASLYKLRAKPAHQ